MRPARLIAALLPLPGLTAPASAHAATSITLAICSGGEAREINLPARDAPLPGPEDRQSCVHFACPRERDTVTDDDDE